MRNAIEVQNLRKTYVDGTEALKGVSFAIPEGGVYGLLGLNGAGKSTFINIMGGLTLKTSGGVRVGGYDLDTQRRAVAMQLGIMPQELAFDPWLTPLESLAMTLRLWGISPRGREEHMHHLLRVLGLEGKKNSRSRSLSGGMQRRLSMAKALVHDPSVVVLDEPTAGVDVEQRQALWRVVERLQTAGRTVILTTHYLEEAERLCDNIVTIEKGRVGFHGTKEQLHRRYGGGVLTFRTEGVCSKKALRELHEVGKVKATAKGSYVLWIRSGGMTAERAIPFLIEKLCGEGVRITSMAARKRTLEEIFIHMTASESHSESPRRGGDVKP